jgi:glutamate carboxypeptidase
MMSATARDSTDLVDLVARWCRIPSHADNRDGLMAMADELIAVLTPIAGRVAIQHVGPYLLPVVQAWSPPRATPSVLLAGHFDTVPHDGTETSPDVQVLNGRIVARGSADMKGGLVVMVEALTRVEAGGSPPSWHVVMVPDEEIGTPWSRTILREAADQSTVALVFEPATANGGLVRRRKGVGTIAITIAGRAAHAGRNPWEGRSAIAAMADLIPRIDALGNRAAGTYVNVTTATAGSAANVIAATARLQVDVRVDSASESERVLAGIGDAARTVGTDRGVEVMVTGGLHRPAMVANPAADALVELYRTAAAVRGLEISWTDVGGGSDANLIAQAGIPVLDGLGVVGGDLHGPDEYALIDSLDERADLTRDLLAAIPVLLAP